MVTVAENEGNSDVLQTTAKVLTEMSMIMPNVRKNSVATVEDSTDLSMAGWQVNNKIYSDFKKVHKQQG